MAGIHEMRASTHEVMPLPHDTQPRVGHICFLIQKVKASHLHAKSLLHGCIFIRDAVYFAVIYIQSPYI